MKKSILIAASVALLLTGCASEYNQVYKAATPTYKYEYAKQCFAQGKYSRAIPLLQEVVTMKKGSTEGEECLYMLAMAEYGLKDYETASEYFKKYYASYPKGQYAEMAKYFVGESLYQNAPEPRLDQSTTYTAITAFQEFLDLYFWSSDGNTYRLLPDRKLYSDYSCTKEYELNSSDYTFRCNYGLPLKLDNGLTINMVMTTDGQVLWSPDPYFERIDG